MKSNLLKNSTFWATLLFAWCVNSLIVSFIVRMFDSNDTRGWRDVLIAVCVYSLAGAIAFAQARGYARRAANRGDRNFRFEWRDEL